MKKFIKYRKNLAYDDNFVYSYKTKVAQIDYERCILWVLDYFSQTTIKHINYAANELDLRLMNMEG